MPRLESITVSHSILSLTCDRNKAVLKAPCSLRLLGAAARLRHHTSTGIGIPPSAPAWHHSLVGSQTLPHHTPDLCQVFYSHFLFQQEGGFVLLLLHCQYEACDTMLYIVNLFDFEKSNTFKGAKIEGEATRLFQLKFTADNVVNFIQL